VENTYIGKAELAKALDISVRSLPRHMPKLKSFGLKPVRIGRLVKFFRPNVDDVLNQVFQERKL